jgi:hypothetical protein
MYASDGDRPKEFAVCTENGPERLPVDSLLGEPPAA